MKKRIADDFNMTAILLIPVSVALNVVVGEVVAALRVPLYLNMIGTILLGILAGPWVGLVGGGLTNLIQGIFNPVSLIFAPVNMAGGFIIGVLSRKRMFLNWKRVFISGVILSIVSILTSAPLQVLAFGGFSGRGSDLVTAFFLAAGENIWSAVISQKIIIDTADKIISAYIAYYIVRKLPDRYLAKLPYARPYMTRILRKFRSKEA